MIANQRTSETKDEKAEVYSPGINDFCNSNVFLLLQVRGRLTKMGALMPMNIFLRQEVDRMQKVISIVRTTLIDLKLAIDGTIIMSENLRDALDNIFDARVPGLWRKVTNFVIVTVSHQIYSFSQFIDFCLTK